MTHIYLSNVSPLLVVSRLRKSSVIVSSNASSFLIIVNYNCFQSNRSILSARMVNECLHIYKRCPTLVTPNRPVSMRQYTVHFVCIMIPHVCDEVLGVTEVLATHVTRTLEGVIEALVA